MKNSWDDKSMKTKKRIEFQLDVVVDADIIEKLEEQFNVGQYIRDLIRKDIQK